ncbi:hypothetical protein J4233_04020 [Candidatus Pacearchaeota archaeon]|nr:hypothetical protein [Candidatus Pacearchaeota archaeon]
MANKIQVIYEGWNPNQEGVTHVAIRTETNPPYIWRAYFKGETIPTLGDDMLIAPIKAARNVFDFKEGKLAEVVAKER